ncbi:MAG: helix-turn-helix domain-containing protein [Butyricicoccus sp.]
MIGALEANGIFLGAVKDVADALHCSQASVYRYLSQIKKRIPRKKWKSKKQVKK